MAPSPIQYFPQPGGSFEVTMVTDNNGAPAQNLEANLPFDVKGNLVITAGNAITGTATVTIYADQLGGQFDAPIGSVPITVTGDGSYPWDVTVTPGTSKLPDVPGCLYRLAAVVTMVNSSGAQTETTAFVEMGMYGIG